MQIEAFAARLKKLNTVTGYFNLAILICILGFIVTTLVRKHRLTPFTWYCICQLAFAVAIVAIGQTFFDDPKGKHCGYGLRAIYVVENIILFSLSTLISYKKVRLCSDVYVFTVHRNLPSEQTIKRKKFVLIAINSVCFTYLVVYLSLSSFFIFSADGPYFQQFNTLNTSATIV